jgi:hypothetical protein
VSFDDDGAQSDSEEEEDDDDAVAMISMQIGKNIPPVVAAGFDFFWQRRWIFYQSDSS